MTSTMRASFHHRRVMNPILVAPLALIPTLAPAAVEVGKDGDDFTIKTSVYDAHIDGHTGLLTKLTIDGSDALSGMSIDLSAVGDIDKREIASDGPTTVTAFMSAHKGDKVFARALRISYKCEENRIDIGILANQGADAGIAGRGATFIIGHDAQMARSLEFKETVPLPSLRRCMPWSRIKLSYANGSALGLTNDGPGNPFNPDENGSLFDWAYGRGGYVANGEYTYSLICEHGGPKAVGSPAMDIKQANTPAVYWQGSPINADLSITKDHYQKIASLKGLHITYEVEDAFGAIAAHGDMPINLADGADPVLLSVPMAITKLGWYRAYFWIEDAGNTLLPGKERLIFSVLKHQANMGESFDPQIQTDYSLGLGLTRAGVNLGDIDGTARMVAENVKAAQGTDVNVSYAIDGSPVGPDPVKFGDLCFKLFDRIKEGIPRVEIINEPNGTMQPKEYVQTYLRPAFENIKKASPNTKVLGPVLCGISPDQARYLDELYRLGLKDITDELTFHPYAGNFDDGNAVPSMQGIMKVIAANGDSAKPIHFTEAGYFHNGWSSLESMQEVVKNAVEQYIWQNAVMGIDHRHNFYYFTDSMGYYTMWLRSNQLTPAAVALRTYTGLVKSQDRAVKLNLGSLESVRAFRFPGLDPKKDQQVIALWTTSNNIPLGAPDPTTAVDFTVQGEVTACDCFGNPISLTVAGGKCTVNVGSYPMYLIAPAATTIDPVPVHWGTDVALTALGATAEASSEQGTGPAVSGIDGNSASDSSWRSLNANELPQSVTVTLSGPTTVDRVGIWGYSPRGYQVEARGADGAWVTVASRRDQPFQRFRTDAFKPMITDQIRLTIVDAYTDRSKVVEIAELQVFSPAGGTDKPLDLVNWALASNGATAKASSEMKKEVTVATMDWGVKTPKINKIQLDGAPANAIDGKRIINDWKEFYPTTWVADTKATGPQWLEIDFAGPKKLSTVTVYTVAFANWTPANSGIRDWEVQIWDGKDWHTVDSIKGNQRVSQISRLKGATTDRIRILVTGTNDPLGTIGIMEVQAYGTRD